MSLAIAHIGASGRVGRLIVEVMPEFSDLVISAAVVSTGSSMLGKGCCDSVVFSSDIESSVTGADVVVDFSTPTSSLTACEAAARRGVPILIGTTGHSQEQKNSIAGFARDVPVLVAPNTSIGIYALRHVSIEAARILGSSFDIEISEAHHRLKKDAPSGTAMMLGDALARETGSTLNLERASHPSVRRDREIGVSVTRGGDVPGEHIVSFHGLGETVELIHRVRDRRIFARGALRLAQMLPEQKPGLIELSSLLSGARR